MFIQNYSGEVCRSSFGGHARTGRCTLDKCRTTKTNKLLIVVLSLLLLRVLLRRNKICDHEPPNRAPLTKNAREEEFEDILQKTASLYNLLLPLKRDSASIVAPKGDYFLLLATFLETSSLSQQQQQQPPPLVYSSSNSSHHHGFSNLGVEFESVECVASSLLYASTGTLVDEETTAPHPLRSPFQQPYAILFSVLCFFLATLTIAARCYVSHTNVTQTNHFIVQLSSNIIPPRFVSPIRNSKNTTVVNDIRAPPTSTLHYHHTSKNLVLRSRSTLFPWKFIFKGDTSVININTTSTTTTTNNNNNGEYSKLVGRNSSSRKFNKRHVAFRSLDARDNGNGLIVEENYSSSVRRKSAENSYYFNNNNNNDDKSGSLTPPPPPEAGDKQKQQLVDLRNSAINDESPLNKSASLNSTNTTTTTAANKQQEEDNKRDNSKVDVTKRPMPPGDDQNNNSFSGYSDGVLVLLAAVVVLTVALGLVTCGLNHYRGGRAANPHDLAQTPTTAPMLSVVSAGATAGVGGMDRLRGHGAASRDHRQMRLHTVHTPDIAINLPPSISLPDGEEHPFNSRLHLRDAEQESEIYQKCIRPPPNRTVLESESPPPYRSNSAGLLGSSCGGSNSHSSSSSEWSCNSGNAPLVVRCHSLSSSSKRPSSDLTNSTNVSSAGGPSSGQKTDFIQKTVKIFTGKRSHHQQQSPAPTLPPPTVIVPRTRRAATSSTTLTSCDSLNNSSCNVYTATSHTNNSLPTASIAAAAAVASISTTAATTTTTISSTANTIVGRPKSNV